MPSGKQTPEHILRQIRRLYTQVGMPQAEIARVVGVHKSVVVNAIQSLPGDEVLSPDEEEEDDFENVEPPEEALDDDDEIEEEEEDDRYEDLDIADGLDLTSDPLDDES